MRYIQTALIVVSLFWVSSCFGEETPPFEELNSSEKQTLFNEFIQSPKKYDQQYMINSIEQGLGSQEQNVFDMAVNAFFWMGQYYSVQDGLNLQSELFTDTLKDRLIEIIKDPRLKNYHSKTMLGLVILYKEDPDLKPVILDYYRNLESKKEKASLLNGLDKYVSWDVKTLENNEDVRKKTSPNSQSEARKQAEESPMIPNDSTNSETKSNDLVSEQEDTSFTINILFGGIIIVLVIMTYLWLRTKSKK